MAGTDRPDPDVDTELLAAVDATDPDNPPVVAKEPTPEREPEPEPVRPAEKAPTPAAPPQKPARSGGFLPMVLGGAIAAVGGYAAAHFDLLSLTRAGDTAPLEQQMAAQATETAALRSEVQRLTAEAAPLAELAPRITELETDLAGQPAPDLSALEARLTALEQRLTAIEQAPTSGGGASPAALAALQAQVDALKGAGASVSADMEKIAAEAEARIAEAEAQAASLKAEAEQIAKAATARAALGRVQAALESGGPFASALADLGSEAPAPLGDLAATGVPTLAQLAQTFPDAARAALDAALRANMGESWSERVTSFLRTQTGARSLTPREGTDPDAILSRAEAALAAGDVPAAIAEAQALPDVAKAAMGTWLAAAEQRVAAEAAVAALAASVGQ